MLNYLTGFSRHADYRQILVSPVTVRKRILAMIEEQTDAGPEGGIVLKLNGLTDAVMIDALYRASGAGVPIDLSVAGLCRLRRRNTRTVREHHGALVGRELSRALPDLPLRRGTEEPRRRVRACRSSCT